MNPIGTQSTLGQQTGGDEISNGHEARAILRMITSQVNKVDMMEVLDDRAMKFLEDMVERANTFVTHFRVSGKSLFWLRDIKDKLIDKGLL